MRWLGMLALMVALIGCRPTQIDGMKRYVKYEALPRGPQSPVEVTIKYTDEDGDTVSLGEDSLWIEVPWDTSFTIAPEAHPLLHLYVKTRDIGDSVTAKIVLEATTVAEGKGTEVSLSYEP